MATQDVVTWSSEEQQQNLANKVSTLVQGVLCVGKIKQHIFDSCWYLQCMNSLRYRTLAKSIQVDMSEHANNAEGVLCTVHIISIHSILSHCPALLV